MSKYKNAMTKELLKEFRKFSKYNPTGLYVFNSSLDAEKEFNKAIRGILKRYDLLVGGTHE